MCWAVLARLLKNYPPTFTGGIDGEAGLRVGVVDTRHPQYPLINVQPAGRWSGSLAGPHG